MLRDLSILYVEDDPMSRKVARILFTEMFGVANLVMFENSYDFLERAEALDPPPNMILLDIHVEPLTGFQMLQLIRSSPALRDLPVVALTASVMNEEVQQLRTAGFQGALGKPLDPDGLNAAFSQILRGEQVWVIAKTK